MAVTEETDLNRDPTAVPLYVPAADGTLVDYVQAQPAGFSYFPKAVFEKYGVKPEDCRAFVSVDERMKPTIGLRDEVLTVSSADHIENGKIYVYLCQGHHGIGRFEKLDNGDIAVSFDDGTSPKLTIPAADLDDFSKFEIVGKVLARLTYFA